MPHRAHIFIALLSANCSEKIFRAGNPHSAIFNNERIIKFWNCRKREFASLALATFAARRKTTVNNEFAQRIQVKVNGACFSQKKQDEKLVSESKVCDADSLIRGALLTTILNINFHFILTKSFFKTLLSGISSKPSRSTFCALSTSPALYNAAARL